MIALAVVALALLGAPAGSCHVDGLLPDRTCTPGGVQTTDLAVICRSSTRGRRDVPRELRRAVFAEYGLSPRQLPGSYEIDHLIPLNVLCSVPVTMLASALESRVVVSVPGPDDV